MGTRECGTVGCPHPHPCSHCSLGTCSTGASKSARPIPLPAHSHSSSGSWEEDRVRWSCQALSGPAVAVAVCCCHPGLSVPGSGTAELLCRGARRDVAATLPSSPVQWGAGCHWVWLSLVQCPSQHAAGVPAALGGLLGFGGAEAHMGGGLWGQPGLCSLLHPSGLCLMIPRW